MKILFLAHRTPYPPNKGDKIRSFHLLAHLAKTHHVTLVYWVDDRRDQAHSGFLQSLCRGKVIPVRLSRLSAVGRGIFSLLRGRSFTEGYYVAPRFRSALADAAHGGPFDAVFMFSSATAFYGKPLQAKIKIVDFVDVDSDKWRQLGDVSVFPLSRLFRLEQRRLARAEVEISNWATASLFVSAADAELFRNQGGAGRVEVLPNGTDLELRRLPLEQIPFHSSRAEGRQHSAGARLIFIGTMNYQPNADAVQYFAKQIFPLIRRKFPQAIFEIVGRYPTKPVQSLAKLQGVRVVGEVPDVRSHLLRADVSVAPLRVARGVQNKVLEAMAMGVPVVATMAAIQGIEVCDGQDVLIGNQPEDFARQVIRLLSDAELRKSITKKARTKMKQLYDWELTGRKLEAVLNTAGMHDPQLSADAEVSRRRG
jgi:sugar transferase (PEP-CTERM/EpsH1 system associated)